MTETIQTAMDRLMTISVEPQDYVAEDGLLYCGSCKTPKEAFFPNGKKLFGRDRHPAECRCRQATREKQEKEERARLHVKPETEKKRRGRRKKSEIFSAMRVFHKPFISDFPQTSGQAAAGYHAAASRTPRKAQQHGQLRHHAGTPHRKQLQTQADGRPAEPPSYRPVHPRCRPGQGPGCRWDSRMHGHPAQPQRCGNL